MLDPRLDVLTVVYGERERPPYVLFVCQDGDQRERFLHGADHQLAGHHWHASASPDQQDHVGRQHVLFAIEPDAHRGRLARSSSHPYTGSRSPSPTSGRPARQLLSGAYVSIPAGRYALALFTERRRQSVA
jgi:hypothetical protein